MRILFVGEAVTLAHVARPVALAAALQARGHDCTVACAPGAARFPLAAGLAHRPLESIPAARFLDALAAGRPVYDVATLERYVQDDLLLLRDVRPDLVIGDFRLSLSVSARLAGVPFASLGNAYWSPLSALPMPLPVLPLSRRLPLPLARALFRIGAPVVMPRHAAPLNAVRRRHGLALLDGGLRAVYTDADHRLYADAPGLYPMRSDPLPPRHHHLGPVLWAPPFPLPDWWADLPGDRPLVYANLGSSGGLDGLAQLLRALSGSRLTVVAATAGGALDAPAPASPGDAVARVHLAPFLPGDQATIRADLVVCNGGSMTCQQALLAGRPILGIAGNMDQFMNMTAVVAAGAGLCRRADRLDAHALRTACEALLTDPAYRNAAVALGQRLRGWDAGERLAALLPTLTGAG